MFVSSNLELGLFVPAPQAAALSSALVEMEEGEVVAVKDGIEMRGSKGRKE